MKTYKVNVRGEQKFCVVVDTGVVAANGRPKVKRFFSTKKNIAVDNAMEFLRTNDTQPEVTKQFKNYPLIKVYDELWDDWRVKVALKEKNPKKKKTLAQDTMTRYEESAKALWKVRNENTNIYAIDKKWVNQFIKDLNSYQSESQAYRIYAVFEKIMTKAEQLDIIEISPTHAFAKDRPTYTAHGKKSIDQDEMKRILKQIKWSYDKYNSQTAFLLLIQAHTGARWGEIAALTVGDVDFKKNRISINKSRSAKTGKVGLTKSGHLRSDEADLGERVVPIFPQFTDMIADYIDHSNLKNENLFDCTYKVTQDTFIAACKRAGSTQKETKIFRRFVSTNLRKQGATRDDVRLALGHSNDATQDIYVTHSYQNADNHAAKLFKALNS